MDLQNLAKELHKPARKHFQRRKVKAFGKDEIWSMDLVDMGDVLEHNDGYRYMLNVIDIWSRYAWSRPLQNKKAETVLKAITDIVDEVGAPPKMVWADQGSEFYNAKLKKYFDKHDITLYSTFGDSKAAVIERFNKTLKQMMWTQFTEKQTRKWIDMLPSLLKHYNHRVHGTLGFSPAEARTGKHDQGLREMNMYSYEVPKKPKLKIGDRVRISRIKGHFEKGYTPNWSYEIYEVTGIKPTVPTTYQLTDGLGETIKGSFYDEELQKTKQNDVWLVEKVIQTKKVRGKKQHLVKWTGHSDKYNSWISDKDLLDV